MYKKKRHVLSYYIQNIIFIKTQTSYTIFKSIKFNRNIKKKYNIVYFLKNKRHISSISKYKSMCVMTGYKRAILNKISCSRFVANKLGKLGMLQNYKP